MTLWLAHRLSSSLSKYSPCLSFRAGMTCRDAGRVSVQAFALSCLKRQRLEGACSAGAKETCCLQQTPERRAGECLISRSHGDKLPSADPKALGWGVPDKQEP